MLVPIDSVAENGHNMRRIATSALDDESLVASIRALGVLQPILVRPHPGAGPEPTYYVVDGRRRLRCARVAGMVQIPVEVQALAEAQAHAAQAAANMVRAPMHPLDQWRAVRALIDDDLSIQQIAAALGLNEIQARRMDRLANLHPAMLELIEKSGTLPDDGDLRVIANAPTDLQAKAAKNRNVYITINGETRVSWAHVCSLCTVQRVSAAHALFPIEGSGLAWDEDLFAEPDDPGRFTTTDIKGFIALQQQTLEQQVADAQAAKKRVQLATWKDSRIQLPKGWHEVYESRKPNKHECLFRCLDVNGIVREQLAEDTAAVRAAQKAREQRAKAKAAGGETDDSGEDTAAADEALPPDPADKPKPGITKAGLDMIASAKTEALRATLRDGIADVSPETLLSIAVLGFGAANITISNLEDGGQWNRRHFRDLAARLLLPGGVLAELSMAELRGLLGELLARVLHVRAPQSAYGMAGSGEAAEWIGAAISASYALPRFDTPEFLATVGGDVLRAVAAEAGIKATGSVSELRKRLAGNLPDWRPSQAVFGAAAPVIEPDDDEDYGDPDGPADGSSQDAEDLEDAA